MSRLTGEIVRIIPDKRFGFVRIPGHSKDFFFHRDDYQGRWEDLLDHKHKVKVSCVVVESAKGPRCADVTPIEDTQENA